MLGDITIIAMVAAVSYVLTTVCKTIARNEAALKTVKMAAIAILAFVLLAVAALAGAPAHGEALPDGFEQHPGQIVRVQDGLVSVKVEGEIFTFFGDGYVEGDKTYVLFFHGVNNPEYWKVLNALSWEKDLWFYLRWTEGGDK